MKVLIIGSGGREHAIASALSQSKKVTKTFCAPGNGGIAKIADCVPIGVLEFDKLADFAEQNDVAITVVGMDEPLVKGIVDVFEARNLAIFGPRKNAAILEGSKVFSKNLMKKYGIPTAEYETFSDYHLACGYVKKHEVPVVVKADGLALGKGVIICMTRDEALLALKDIMVDEKFGEAGKNVVIEEFMIGREISLLCFCDGKTIVPMVSAQDYKRAFDGNKGPNTGGMGSISPSPVMSAEMERYIYEKIALPTVAAMRDEGREFKGVIYLGLMVTEGGIKIVEYNARFGDPETQVILPRLKTDLIDIFFAVVNGTLDSLNIEWYDSAVCCVVMASGGYPVEYKTGYKITGIEEAEETAHVFHAGTKLSDGALVTGGGRVLGVTGVGRNIDEARECAYNAVRKISFTDAHFRTDIGEI